MRRRSRLRRRYGRSLGLAGRRSTLLEARGQGATHVTTYDLDEGSLLVYRPGHVGKWESALIAPRDGRWIMTGWDRAAFGGWLPDNAQPINETLRRAA